MDRETQQDINKKMSNGQNSTILQSQNINLILILIVNLIRFQNI